MERGRLILLFAVFLFLFGCSAIIEDYADEYTKGIDLRNPQLLFDADAGSCPVSECTCFSCGREHTTLCGLYELTFGEGKCPFDSMVGTSCQFTTCTKENYLDLHTSDNMLRPFMIGSGSTFGDFQGANSYCKDSLDMSVKWLVGTETSSYTMPSGSRAECFLDKGVTPLYILYSEGKNIDVARAGEIADELKGTSAGHDIGPVIITSEIDFDSNDDVAVDNVKNQILKMDEKCPKCLIALAPRYLDREGVNKVLEDPSIRDKVDIVAYGINSRYSQSQCEYGSLYLEATGFSRYIRDNYDKPTLIAYIMLEEGAGPSGCIWTREKIEEAHSQFFKAALPVFLNSGTIGVAPYSFNSSRSSDYSAGNPLRCTSCSLGENKNSKPDGSASGSFAEWFALCQKYKESITVLNPEIDDINEQSSGEILAIYPQKTGGTCGFGINYNFYFNLVAGDEKGLDFQTPPLDAPEKPAYSCAACVTSNRTFAFDIRATTTSPADKCTLYPEVETYAEINDVDPMLVRAVIWQESDFNQCAAAKAQDSDDPTDPNDDNVQTCSVGTYKSVPDPDGLCHEADVRLSSPYNGYCAFGLMQVIESPNKNRDSLNLLNSVGNSDPRGDEDLATAENLCTEDPNVAEFNPYNPKHNVCWGTRKLADYLTDANEQVTSKLSVEEKQALKMTNDQGAESLFNTYIGLHGYFGDAGGNFGNANAWVDRYVEQKGIVDSSACNSNPDAYTCCKSGSKDRLQSTGGACCGIGSEAKGGDFVSYVKSCEIPSIGGTSDYGYDVLSKYRKLISDPPSGCVDATCPPSKYYSNVPGLRLPPGT